MSSAATAIHLPGGAKFYEQITSLKHPDEIKKAPGIITMFFYDLACATFPASLTEEKVQKDVQLLSSEIQKIYKVAKDIKGIMDINNISRIQNELEQFAKYYSSKYTIPCKSAGTSTQADWRWKGKTASDYIHRGMISQLLNIHSTYNQSGDMAGSLYFILSAAQCLLDAAATGKVYDQDKNLLDAKTVTEEFTLLADDLDKIAELSELESEKPDRENWKNNKELQQRIKELRVMSEKLRKH